MAKPTTSTPHKNIYQIKVTLKGSKPPIWRRLLIPSSITLWQLHRILQIAMGWGGYHMHQFVDGGLFYGDTSRHSDLYDEMLNEHKVKLDQLVHNVKAYITYEYDFGDGWEHKVELEKILPFDSPLAIPLCIKGKRACPPEDIGGVWGYKEYLDAINNPDHPEHKQYLEDYGPLKDPERLDIKKINQKLDNDTLR